MTIDYSTLTKRYYSIGEVSQLFGVKPSVLRFWEENFKELRPRKSGGGKRLYTQDDIKVIERIYHLTREEGYTLEGAEKALKQHTEQELVWNAQESSLFHQRLSRIQRKLKNILSSKPNWSRIS